MSTEITKTTAYHEVPANVLSVLKKDSALIEIWNGLTDIQRNEWTCYAMTGTKPETRDKHLKRLVSDMLDGKKTPCCWPGCPHRRPKAAKWFGENNFHQLTIFINPPNQPDLAGFLMCTSLTSLSIAKYY